MVTINELQNFSEKIHKYQKTTTAKQQALKILVYIRILIFALCSMVAFYRFGTLLNTGTVEDFKTWIPPLAFLFLIPILVCYVCNDLIFVICFLKQSKNANDIDMSKNKSEIISALSKKSSAINNIRSNSYYSFNVIQQKRSIKLPVAICNTLAFLIGTMNNTPFTSGTLIEHQGFSLVFCVFFFGVIIYFITGLALTIMDLTIERPYANSSFFNKKYYKLYYQIREIASEPYRKTANASQSYSSSSSYNSSSSSSQIDDYKAFYEKATSGTLSSAERDAFDRKWGG